MINSAGARSVNRPPEEVLGKDDTEIFDQETAHRVREDDRKVMETGETLIFDYTIPTLNGPVTHIASRSPYRDQDGNIVGVIGVSHDITRRKRAEEALRISKTRYKSLVLATAQIIWTADPEGRVIEPLPSWQEYTGQSDEEVAGWGWTSAIHPDDFNSILEQLRQSTVIKTIYDYEYRLRRSDGIYRRFAVRAVPVLNEDGSTREWVGVCADITDQKQTDEEKNRLLKELQERVKELTAFHQTARLLQNENLTIEELLEEIAALLPPAWQYPEFAAARVEYREMSFQTAGFRETQWKQQSEFSTSDGVRGCIKVVYIEHPDEAIENPFLAEEQALLDSISEMLRIQIDRRIVLSALQASESRSRQLIESSLIGIIYWDMKGRIIDANDTFLNMVGYSRDDLMKGMLRWTDMTPAEYRELDSIALEQIRETGSCAPFEKEYYRKDGSRVPVLLAGTMIDNDPGDLICFVIDRSPLLSAETALRQSESLQSAILKSIPAYIALLDREGNILLINDRWRSFRNEYTFHGTDYDVGANYIHLCEESEIRLSEARQAAMGIRSVLDGAVDHFEMEYPCHSPYGKQWFRLTATRWPVDERLAGAVVMHIDITQHKTVEEQLRRSQSSLQKSQEIAHLGSYELNIPYSPSDYWSDEIFRIFGLDPKTGTMNIEEAINSIVHPDDKDTVRRVIEKAIDEGEAFDFECRIVRPGGNIRRVRSMGGPLLDKSGRVIKLIGTLADVTDRWHLENQLRQAQKMEAIGKLAGGVAHDFNNLLTVIQGYSEMLLDKVPADTPAREMIGEVRKAADRAAALTHQLLAFSRRQVLAPVVLDINALIGDINRMLQRLIGEDIHIKTYLSHDLWRVKADASQVEQVIMNLAVNARDAMPGGGDLIISTDNIWLNEERLKDYEEVKPGAYAMLTVTDTGTGMDEDTVAHIFEPFFTTKEIGKGTGLGLATVYGIVKQSDGHIEVNSLPGSTTFRIYLPRAEEADLLKRHSGSANFSSKGDETILVAEDEEGVRSLVCLILQSSGYAVLEARNGRQALSLAQMHQGTIHLLITDIVMPTISGRELSNKIRLIRPGIKVLYLSGYSEDVLADQNEVEPDSTFLQKPFTPVALTGKVREILDAQKAIN
jgi:PAS domain S-box-containing protein